MTVKRRRRIDAVVLGLVAVVLGVSAAVVARVGEVERVSHYWVDAQLDSSGRARVVELIEYDFGSKRRHGIFREIPDIDSSVPTQVFSETAPDRAEVTERMQFTTFKIGDPDKRISGSHVYQINYGLTSLEVDDRIVWDAVGTSWSVGMDKVVINLRSPFALVEPVCWVGRLGSTDSCSVEAVGPGHVVVQLEKLEAGEGVTIAARHGHLTLITQGPPRPSLLAGNPGPSLLWVALAGWLSAGALMPIISFWFRRRGREQLRDSSGAVTLVDAAELPDHAALHSVAFPDLEPWQAGVLWDEQALPRHQTAWLVQQAAEGQILLEGDKNVTLKVGPAGLKDRLLILMFHGRESVELGKFDPSFGVAWDAVNEQIEDFAHDITLWDPAADRFRRSVSIGGAFAAVLGLNIAAYGSISTDRYGWWSLPLIVPGMLMAGAGVAAVLRAWELRVRTPEGSEAWLSIEMFRRYLAQAEAQQAEWAAENGVVTQYAAWAIALGEIDQWTKAVKSSSAFARSGHAQMGWTAMRMVPLFSNLERSTVSTATSPSSSSSGGGSVGGGGGGGGGGSW